LGLNSLAGAGPLQQVLVGLVVAGVIDIHAQADRGPMTTVGIGRAVQIPVGNAGKDERPLLGLLPADHVQVQRGFLRRRRRVLCRLGRRMQEDRAGQQ
jgi:hypothetical protein